MKTVDVWGWKRSALLHNVKMKMLLSGEYKVGIILDGNPNRLQYDSEIYRCVC